MDDQVPVSDLLTRARNHIAIMASHQRDRTQGQLLIELTKEADRLERESDEMAERVDFLEKRLLLLNGMKSR